MGTAAGSGLPILAAKLPTLSKPLARRLLDAGDRHRHGRQPARYFCIDAAYSRRATPSCARPFATVSRATCARS